jgi:hypothetical protein
MLPEQSPSGQPSSEPPPDRSPEETRVTMSALQRGWERGRSVFDPAGSNGEGTPEPGAVAASPGDPDVIDATDAEHVVDAGATTTGDGAGAGAGQAAADTGITADSAAGRTDGGGASTGTHRTED